MYLPVVNNLIFFYLLYRQIPCDITYLQNDPVMWWSVAGKNMQTVDENTKQTKNFVKSRGTTEKWSFFLGERVQSKSARVIFQPVNNSFSKKSVLFTFFWSACCCFASQDRPYFTLKSKQNFAAGSLHRFHVL